MTHIAFLGTGLLGSGMVESMLRRDLSVTVWNRTASKAKALQSAGASIADTPEQAVAAADEIHMTLSDDAAVDALLSDLAAIPDALVFDDVHGRPAWRRAVTAHLAGEILDELAAP